MAEGAAVDGLVADLSDEQWHAGTASAGWTIAHQIGHLAWTDRAALLSVEDPQGFADSLTEAWRNPTGFVDEAAEVEARTPPPELLSRWRAGRAALADALLAVPAGTKLPWYGPPMSPMSMATARLMETWAHGQDVAAAVGAQLAPTSRLRSIAHLGVRTRDFAYSVNELSPPDQEFRVELTGPDGDSWAWGPADAAQRVTGPALDFCLLVTQRAHRDDLALTTVGAEAAHWLTIAQAFAGPPGAGRDRKDDA
ncbi:wyosine base formation protein [Rhodococcus triatomae BKS 15-14]|nr:wyosine base formation protein [Rhodococcus triatomae BKS 15-14]